MDHEYNLATWLRKHPELAARHGAAGRVPDRRTSISRSSSRAATTASAAAPRKAREPAVDGGGHRLAGRDVRGRRDQHRGRRLRRLRLRRVRCPPGRARGRGPPRGIRRELVARRHGRFLPAPLRAGARPAAGRLDLREIQWDNLLDAEAQAPLRALPEGGIYQHTINRSLLGAGQREMTPEYGRGAADEDTTSSARQFCCQWNGDYRTERYRFNGKRLRRAGQEGGRGRVPRADRLGRAVALHVSTELSYLAFARFTWDPTLDLGAVHADGGRAPARRRGGRRAIHRAGRDARRQPDDRDGGAGPDPGRGAERGPGRKWRCHPALALAGGHGCPPTLQPADVPMGGPR